MADRSAAEHRDRQKRAYYRVLTERSAAFQAALADLFRRMDGILVPLDRNALRWDLLDAAHAGDPAVTLQAYRAIAEECERCAATADGAEAERWREEAERPRRIAGVLAAAEEFRVWWFLPREGARDLIDAYLRGEEGIAPIGETNDPTPPWSIRLTPSAATPDWVIPIDPALPPSERRLDLERRLEELFAALREQAARQVEELEANLRTQVQAAMPGEGTDATNREALALYRRLYERASWEEIAREIGAPTDAVRARVAAWMRDLGIATGDDPLTAPPGGASDRE